MIIWPNTHKSEFLYKKKTLSNNYFTSTIVNINNYYFDVFTQVRYFTFHFVNVQIIANYQYSFTVGYQVCCKS